VDTHDRSDDSIVIVQGCGGVRAMEGGWLIFGIDLFSSFRAGFGDFDINSPY